MILVAIAMIAIIAMAALSIDIITLYLAKEEAQRSADTAALAAARVISLSGMTGDPGNTTLSWQAICGPPNSPATQAATAVVQQNAVGSMAIPTSSITVTYSAGIGGGASSPDCSTLPAAFGINPMVTVQVKRNSLPTFFSRIWGNTGNSVSATAVAEAFNPSASDLNTNGAPIGTVTPVQPNCVKPWVVPNVDPLNPAPGGNGCTPTGAGACKPLVSTTDGSIVNKGISLGGSSATGVIGETFWLVPDCKIATPGTCTFHNGAPQPQANFSPTGFGLGVIPRPPNLLYVPGQVGNPVVAIPACAQGNAYQEAIGGCDSPANYQCGMPGLNNVDLSVNPGAGGSTTAATLCLTHQSDETNLTGPSGQDYLNIFQKPNAYPFQILSGSSNPLGLAAGTPITSSNSIVSLPIYDNTVNINNNNSTTAVTFVGFLQVFINAVDRYGNLNVTVLNVAGCGNGNITPVGLNPVAGTSPVPIRLITPP
jgi:hypothetical protein